MIDSPRGPPDLLRQTSSMTAVEVTLLTVVSVNVVLVMDSVITTGLEAVGLGFVIIPLVLDLQFVVIYLRIIPATLWPILIILIITSPLQVSLSQTADLLNFVRMFAEHCCSWL